MFDPASIKQFWFLPPTLDEADDEAILRLPYAFDDSYEFVEEMRFPLGADGIPEGNRPALERALFLLSLAAGISYYKAAVPQAASIESGTITEAELAWLQQLYLNGLGEFAYVNKMPTAGRPAFHADVVAERIAIPAPSLERKSLIAVGGGKDSCVSIETVRRGGEPIVLAALNGPRAIVEVMAESGLDHRIITRKISSELLRLNNEGAYNGHVPVTAIVSLTLVAAALMWGCDTVVMSNERSASVGNMTWEGRDINHQYSKSLPAERQLADVVQRSIGPTPKYFSLLRPLSELEITRRFADMDRYHHVFTSCNRAFRIDESRRVEYWCTDCPKCRFVFLALAPFMSPEKLIAIFGGVNMLDRLEQAKDFDALIGYDAHKPFECVGEVEESVAAFVLLATDERWASSALVKRFVDEILPNITLPSDLLEKPFIASVDHNVPAKFVELLKVGARAAE